MRATTTVNQSLPGLKDALLFLPYGIGDVVMHWKSLALLRHHMPTTWICAAGSKPAIQLLDDSRLADSTVTYDRWDIQHLWDSGTADGTHTFRKWFSEMQFRGVINSTLAPPVLQGALADVAHFDMNGDLYCTLLEEGRSGYEAVYRSSCTGWMLGNGEDEDAPLTISDAHGAEGCKAIRDFGGCASPFAVICPSASLPMKRWPLDRFTALADWIRNHFGLRVVFTAGPSDHLNDVPLLPPMHLLTTAAVLQHARLVVSNDTGIMHLAAKVGAPTVGIFGPTDPRVFLPPGARTIAVGGVQINCPKHGSHSWGLPQCWGENACPLRAESCINQVDLEEVQAAVEQVLNISIC